MYSLRMCHHLYITMSPVMRVFLVRSHSPWRSPTYQHESNQYSTCKVHLDGCHPWVPILARSIKTLKVLRDRPYA
ncbi:hypothetical protein AG1IA_07098 [Rhizoctonia solani AG-1 IA]|uniref:Uncharacterized protein n=1 Tax=Thanatephorus cucumeris (strain AG1-IA) TaxID=983506 RepID=L8WR88_THACA|nr:hypothetical protein AG1IA_07098 [Rhizoctonia solani AG-1 IA]